MGDFAHADLTRADGLYPQHADVPCAGCGAELAPRDRCYADGGYIWHARCWPSIDAALADDPVAQEGRSLIEYDAIRGEQTHG